MRQASLLSEWGKMGVTLVRVGSSYVSGAEWTAEAQAEALREWRFVADAASLLSGIHLINLYKHGPMQWQAFLSVRPTAADWQRWTLGNMSLI